MITSLVDEIREEVEALPEELQMRVLEYTRTISPGRLTGTPGHHLLKFFGVISSEDAEIMREEIEKACEQVYPNEW